MRTDNMQNVGVHMLCRHMHDFHGILTKVAYITFQSHTVMEKIMHKAHCSDIVPCQKLNEWQKNLFSEPYMLYFFTTSSAKF